MKALGWLLLFVMSFAQAQAQGPARDGPNRADSVVVSFVDADLRTVVQGLGRYLDKPVLAAAVPQARVSLETPTPLPRAMVLDLLRGVVGSHGLEVVEEPAFYQVRPRAVEPARPGAEAPVAPRQIAGPQLHIFRLRHARASDVAATVSLLYGGQGTFAGSGPLSAGTLSDELRRAGMPPPAGPGQEPPGARRPSGELTGQVTIIPDDVTNSLLVRANDEDYGLLREAIEQLDIRPLQVLIEVLIVEARNDRSFSLGADLFVPPQRVGSGNTTIGGSTTGGGLGDLVVKVLNVGSANVNATIRAAASRGNVRIVSRPVLLAANNTEARLLVGTQRPFIQVSRSLPTDAPVRDQVVQYRDVGTRLVVRPTINQDGYVSLQVQQEVNAATTETQFDAPIISTREAATRVLVRDGQTIVLGGMRDVQHDRTRGGVPWLSDLPLVGGLFGRASSSRTETELYLFLTPRILRDDAAVDSLTAPRLPRNLEP